MIQLSETYETGYCVTLICFFLFFPIQVNNMGIEMENHGAPGTGGVVDIGECYERFEPLRSD